MTTIAATMINTSSVTANSARPNVPARRRITQPHLIRARLPQGNRPEGAVGTQDRLALGTSVDLGLGRPAGIPHVAEHEIAGRGGRHLQRQLVAGPRQPADCLASGSGRNRGQLRRRPLRSPPAAPDRSRTLCTAYQRFVGVLATCASWMICARGRALVLR